MRIGIFVACAGRRDGGPETYELGLVRALARSQTQNEYQVYCFSQEAADAFGLDQGNVRFKVLRPRHRAISTVISLPLSLRRERLDVLHATMYPPLVSPVNYVFTMHDASPLAHPNYYPSGVRAGLKFLVARGLQKARLIVCPTEDARQTTADQFRINLDRISVVYHGIDPRFRPSPPAAAQDMLRERYAIQTPYALYVGKLQPRKNIVRMMEALALLRRELPDLTLVLCGRRFGDTDFMDQALARLDLKDRVVEIGYVPSEDLPVLYSGAAMVLYPTLFEGFGFPVVEAMACGTPVITSNVSCLPEVAGGAALLVNPERVEEIAEAMRRLYSDSALRQTLREKGLARASTFTWETAAGKMLEIYRRAGAP